jgi:hypothetical protein
MFENRVLRRIFGPKKDEVTRKWSKLCNVGLNDLYSLNRYYSEDQISMNEVGLACSTYEGEERYIQGFGGDA